MGICPIGLLYFEAKLLSQECVIGISYRQCKVSGLGYAAIFGIPETKHWFGYFKTYLAPFSCLKRDLLKGDQLLDWSYCRACLIAQIQLYGFFARTVTAVFQSNRNGQAVLGGETVFIKRHVLICEGGIGKPLSKEE